jgi:CHAT domain-containing protein
MAPKSTVIHLATHASSEPLESKSKEPPGWIALAPSGDDNGYLTTSEIMDLHFEKAPLVVLSACDTGRGTITADGVIGLSRAFFAVGASELVVSLWDV